MKQLLIMRHAKSSWADSGLSDFDRSLNNRGNRDAPVMGRRLRERKLIPDFIVSSAALRARTTAEIVAAELGYPPEKISTTEILYLAGTTTLLESVNSLDESFERVMFFGHNPGMTEFVNELCNTSIVNIPTAGVAHCLLDIDSWSEVVFGLGVLQSFDYPKNSE